jgi:hypothetical protein
MRRVKRNNNNNNNNKRRGPSAQANYTDLATADNNINNNNIGDRLCHLVVRVPGFRSRGPGIDSRRYLIYWEVLGLERGPLSLVSTIEELPERKTSG